MEIIDVTVGVTTFFTSAGLRIPACSLIDTRDCVILCALRFELFTRLRIHTRFAFIHGFWKRKLTTRFRATRSRSTLDPSARFASCSLCNLFLISVEKSASLLSKIRNSGRKISVVSYLLRFLSSLYASIHFLRTYYIFKLFLYDDFNNFKKHLF